MINRRRGHFERIFETLRKAGIERRDLYLAWDFTVASDQSITGRALHMRDDAFGSLGDTNLADLAVAGQAPRFQVTQVETFTPEQNAQLARRVRGTVSVPCYLEPNCAPGSRFQLDSRGLPTSNGTWDANFDCIIPRLRGRRGLVARSSVALRAWAVRPGGRGRLERPARARQHLQLRPLRHRRDRNVAGRPWNGVPDHERREQLPEARGPVAAGTAERARSRARDDPSRGLGSHLAFRVGSTSVIDTSRLYYDGNSQGGIMGGASPRRARLHAGRAGGARHEVLAAGPAVGRLRPFAALLYPNYPDELVRPLILTLVQMLWDRGEPNGYANRMTTNPLPDTPPHRVLLNRRLGDHQVTNFAADVEARTIGASAHVPILDPGTLARRRRARRGAADHELPCGLGHLLLGYGPGARRHRGAAAAVENVPNRAGRIPTEPRGAPSRSS